MSAPVQLALALLGLIISAHTRVQATVVGAHLNVPVLGIVAVAVVLTLIALVLWLARSILRDGGLHLRPRMVAT